MVERLKALVGGLGRLCGWVIRFLVRIVVTATGRLGRAARIVSLERQIRVEERTRREVFEGLGKMVFLLHKRSLVRNADLLVECERVDALDRHIDELCARVDEVKVARVRPAEAAPLVVSTAAEVDYADPATPLAPSV